MNRRLRLGALIVLAALLIASPTALIIARAERGSATFGDSELIGRDRISSATLDIAVGTEAASVRADNIAPGDLSVGWIKLINAGSIPLHYSVRVRGDAGVLAPWLSWRFAPATYGTACPTAPGWLASTAATEVVVAGEALDDDAVLRVFGDPAPGQDAGDRILAVGGIELLCVAASLSVDAPNEAQAERAELTFVVDAEQHATEPAS